MYEVCLRGVIPDSSDLLAKDDIVKLKRCVFAQVSLGISDIGNSLLNPIFYARLPRPSLPSPPTTLSTTPPTPS